MDDMNSEGIDDGRQDPRSERSSLLFDLDETAALLTTEEDDLDLIWLTQPALYIAVGFMLRCQRLVRGMVSLIENGLLDAAVVLARPTIESAVTGLWLLETGRDGLRKLMGFDRKEARRFISSVTGEKPAHGPFDSSIRFWFDTAEDRELVPIRERAGRLFPWLQLMHFESHSWMHATIKASYLSFDTDEVEKDPERRGWAGLLPRNLQQDVGNAAVIALLLGREVHRRLGWEAGEFDELLEGLGAAEEMLALFQ